MENKERKIQIIILIVGLLIGFGAGFLVFSKSGELEELIDQAEQNSRQIDLKQTEMPTLSTWQVAVADQGPGDSVYIETATLPAPGWIAIYDDLTGQPGSNLGARFFDTGEYEGVTVSLLANTVAPGTYYAILHEDDGKIVETSFGRHPFDHTLDPVVTDSAGEVLAEPFEVIIIGARGI
ncbi:MAG: hypothetical protein WDZ85_02780 [Candidatus Paceibacterota bacterium]